MISIINKIESVNHMNGMRVILNTGSNKARARDEAQAKQHILVPGCRGRAPKGLDTRLGNYHLSYTLTPHASATWDGRCVRPGQTWCVMTPVGL